MSDLSSYPFPGRRLGNPALTKNRRYEAYYDALNDARIAAAPLPPCSLPRQAYGPQEIVWAREPVPVWAWIIWPDRPAEKLPCTATGWNDRVVFVQWYSQRGQVQATVWRNAVTHRRPR